MGFGDAEIVALSGAHTLGRAFKERSGVTECSHADGGKHGTPFTSGGANPRADGVPGLGMPGGESWVENWLTFDNAYFQYLRKGPQQGLLWLPTDAALHDSADHCETCPSDAAGVYCEGNGCEDCADCEELCIPENQGPSGFVPDGGVLRLRNRGVEIGFRSEPYD